MMHQKERDSVQGVLLENCQKMAGCLQFTKKELQTLKLIFATNHNVVKMHF